MKLFFLLILLAFTFSGCVAEKGKISVDVKMKKNQNKQSIDSISVSSVKIENNQLVISGANLINVESIKIDGVSFSELFKIEAKSTNKIVANSLRAVSFDISKIFSLILSDANASASFPINFSLCQATLNGVGFNCSVAPGPNDVLSYDLTTNSWKPRSINGLNYHGGWDATTTPPVAVSPGDYYIVTVADGQYAVGDWIVWNGSQYDQIANSSPINSVFGRTGAVVATKGDYDLNKLQDVDLPSGSLASGKVLKYDGSKWVAGDDLSGGGSGSISTSEIADGAVTDIKINTVSASKITGTITSSQIFDGTIVNADISGTAGIDYSKLNIADGDIPAAKISGLPSATSVLTTTITDGDTTHAPNGNAVFDALGLKLNLAGGVINPGGTITGLPALPLAGSEATSKDYVDSLVNWEVSGSNVYRLSGRVGIGTDNPDTLLHVAGVIKSTTGGFTFPDGSNQTKAAQSYATSALPSCSAGQVLFSNGTSFSCVTDAAGAAAFSGIASRAVATGAGGALEVSTTTATELGYVSGVTSAIQTQLNGKQATIATGTTAQYYRGDKSWQTLSDVVLGTTLTGLSVASSAIVAAADTILVGIGKLQAQVSALSSSKLSLTGGTLTTGTINGIPTPVGGSDAVNKSYVDSFGQWVKSGTDISYTAGSVVMKMDSRSCNSTRGGALRFNTTSKLMEFCNETSWSPIGADLSPDSFSFANLVLQPAGQLMLSENKVISGLSGTTPVAIAGAGAEFRINSGSWVTSGNINPGNSIQMRMTTSSNPGEVMTADLTVGTYTAPTWSISTYNTLYTNSAVSQSTIYAAGVTGTVANLSDNAATTGAGTNNGTTEFIALDLGSAQDVQFIRLAGGNLPSWGNVSSYLNGSSIQYSNNNSTWTTVATVSGVTDPSGFAAHHIAFPLVNARYWRVFKNGYIATSELGVGK